MGDPGLVGVGFFCFHVLEDTKQKKLTPLDRGPPLHVNRVLLVGVNDGNVIITQRFHAVADQENRDFLWRHSPLVY